MTAIANPTSTLINGFDTATLQGAAEQLAAEPTQAQAEFRVNTCWLGGSRVRSQVGNLVLGGEVIERKHAIDVDEPTQLFGTDQAPNPAELLLSAVSACMAITCAANAAMMGIELQALSIEMYGQLDLRGALGVSSDIQSGFDGVECVVRIKSQATGEQLKELLDSVEQTSPNFDNLTRAIGLQRRFELA